MKKILCLLLLGAVLVAATSCGVTPKGASYTQAALDLYYQQDSAAYCKLTGATAEEADEQYRDMLEENVSYFEQYFALSEVSDETEAELEALYQQLFAKVEYKVLSATTTEEGDTVEVSVTPLPFIETCAPLYEHYVDVFTANYETNKEQYADKDAFLAAFSEGVVKLCAEQVSALTPSPATTMTLTVRETEDGSEFADNGLAYLNTTVITYPEMKEESE